MASSSSSIVKEEKPRVATGLNKDGTLTLEMAKKGQRYPEESPGSGDYVFYQTLYEENPESPMALVWCIEHGIFEAEKAVELHKKYLKAKEIFVKNNKAVAASSSIDYGMSEKKKKKRKVTVTDVAGDAGMAITMSEGIGTQIMA